MKKIYYVLPIVAILVFMGVRIHMDSVAEGPGLVNMGKINEAEAQQSPGTKKILVAYFSRTGNTREIANQIHRGVGGDMVEIQVVEPYPEDYEEVKKVAMQEQVSGYKPALKTKIRNMKTYDVVFIGYPIWWGRLPTPIRTFLSEYDFSGKIIVPFCTHGGSGLSGSVADIRKLCPKSTIQDGLAVWGRDAKNAQSDVSAWLRKIKTTD